MNATNATIPSSAVVAASFVLSYSFICLGCGILLVVVLHLSREKFSCSFGIIYYLMVADVCH